MKKLAPILITFLLAILGVCLAFFLVFAAVGFSTAVQEDPLPMPLSAGVVIGCVATSFWSWRQIRRKLVVAAVVLARAATVSLASFGIFFGLWNWLLFHQPIVQVIPLKSSYALSVYQDWDVGGEERNFSLQDPRTSSRRAFFAFVAGEQKPAPHFTAHTTADRRLSWVTTDTKPDQIVFLLDFSNSLYWPGAVQGPARWPNDASYLDRINADGGQRYFYAGYERLDAPGPRH